jgi:hypothetical protein
MSQETYDLAGTTLKYAMKATAIEKMLESMTDGEREKIFDGLSGRFCFDCGKGLLRGQVCNCTTGSTVSR